MTTRRVTGSALIILLVLFLGFTLSVPRTKDIVEEGDALQTQESHPQPTLSLERSYRRGTHTLTGTLLVDTRCTKLTTEVEVTPEGIVPPTITLRLATEDTAGVCLMLSEERAFSITADAPEDATVLVFVNDKLVPTPEQE